MASDVDGSADVDVKPEVETVFDADVWVVCDIDVDGEGAAVDSSVGVGEGLDDDG